MKCIIYIRVSGDEQVKGTSLDSQEEKCREFCAKKGFEVVHMFKEEGESAKDLSLNNRKAFLAALDFCKKAKVDAFVVFKVDRFARHTEDHFAVRALLRQRGVTLYSATEPIGNTPSEKFLETMLAGVAEFDNAIRKERCENGMKERINQGIWPFKPPLGYICAQHRRRGEKKTVPDQPHPKLFPLIQRALRAYATGEVTSQKQLAQQLKRWGFRNASGIKMNPQRIDYMLGKHLPFYAGLLIDPFTRTEKPGLHVPMITRAEMAAIRMRRTGNPAAVNPSPIRRLRYNPEFHLRRLVRCAVCDRSLTGATSRGRSGWYGYYFCTNRRCSARYKSIPNTLLHTSFTNELRSLRLTKEAMTRVEAFLRSKWKAEKVGRDNDYAENTKSLRELKDRRTRIHEMREEGSYDMETFRARLQEVNDSIALVEAAIERPRSFSDLDIEEVLEAARWFMNALSETWLRVRSEPSRARFERLMFPRGIHGFTNGTLRTVEPGLLLAVSQTKNDEESLEVHPSGISSNQIYEYCEELLSFYREIVGKFKRRGSERRR